MDDSSAPNLHQQLLHARKDLCERCIAQLTTRPHENVVLDFRYIRFDPSGTTRLEKDLARILVAHIVAYCLKGDRIAEYLKNPVGFEWMDARDLFTKRSMSGESGELLLYLLIETTLEAPQVLAKMSLKTSPDMEVHGADGVHIRYNGPERPLDVFLGESKLYQDAASAIDDALKSIAEVRANGVGRELMLATENFKWMTHDAKDKILGLMNPNMGSHSCNIHFVVLIGFELRPHGNLKTAETKAGFLTRYASRANNLSELTIEKLSAAEHPANDIVHVFYVPFSDIDAFRTEFVRCLSK